MSEIDEPTIIVDGHLPEIASVKARDRLTVDIVWRAGGQTKTDRSVDLAPDILTFKIYAPLRADRDLFESVGVADDGNAIAWGDGRIDMPATAVERLAADKMVAEDLRAFMQAADLTRDGLAAQLGVSRRLVGYWLEGQTIPRYIKLACRALAAEHDVAAERSSIMARGRTNDRSEIDPTFEDRRNSFHQALLEDNDLQMILHGHLWIEDELMRFIEVATPSPGRFKKLGYSKRVEVAAKNGLQFGLKEPLQAIGRLRNRFAHEFTTVGIADPVSLERAFSSFAKEVTANCYTKTREKLGSAERPERIDLLSPKEQCAFHFVAVWSALAAQTHHIKRKRRELGDPRDSKLAVP